MSIMDPRCTDQSRALKFCKTAPWRLVGAGFPRGWLVTGAGYCGWKKKSDTPPIQDG